MPTHKRTMPIETRLKISEKMKIIRKDKKPSDKTIKASAEARRGRPLSEETKRKITSFMKTRPALEETRKKLSVKGKGRKFSDEWKRRLSESHKGKRHSIEHKRKISESLRGYYSTAAGKECAHNHSMRSKGKKVHSEETKRMFSELYRGKPRSQETIHKMSEALKGHKYSPERNKSISKTLKGRLPSHNIRAGICFRYMSPYQGEIILRSSYELAFAKYLDSVNEMWFYEFWTFDIGDTTYTPDFYLPRHDKFIEIKGFMHKRTQQKINRLADEYPQADLEILYGNDLLGMGCELPLYHRNRVGDQDSTTRDATAHTGTQP